MKKAVPIVVSIIYTSLLLSCFSIKGQNNDKMLISFIDSIGKLNPDSWIKTVSFYQLTPRPFKKYD